MEIVELRKKFSILNCGYGGDQTQHLLWRAKYGELDGYEAKLVMLLCGTKTVRKNSISQFLRTFPLIIRAVVRPIIAPQAPAWASGRASRRAPRRWNGCRGA